MIFIPRAVIFCDDDELISMIAPLIQELPKEAAKRRTEPELDCAVLTNTAGAEWARTLKDFSDGKLSFLFTKTEPNIFQISMPRVFWIIHFGVPTDKLQWYGCRLCSLDESLRGGSHQSGVSVLFLPPQGGGSIVPEIEKLFSL